MAKKPKDTTTEKKPSVLKKITDGIKEVAKKVTPKVKKVVEKAAPKVTEQVAKKATEETVDYFFDPETGVIVGSDTTTDTYETPDLDTPLDPPYPIPIG